MPACLLCLGSQGRPWRLGDQQLVHIWINTTSIIALRWENLSPSFFLWKYPLPLSLHACLLEYIFTEVSNKGCWVTYLIHWSSIMWKIHMQNMFSSYIDLIQKRQGMFINLIQKMYVLLSKVWIFKQKKRRDWNNMNLIDFPYDLLLSH